MRAPKIFVSLLIVLMLCLGASLVHADAVRVISYGKDLTVAQKDKIYGLFGLKAEEKKDIAVTEVSNDEEREYLEGLVEKDVIGSKAISSAFVELLGAGEGIRVQTHNITWVTPEMYANALATAEVKDARIIAAAPFDVSGTAALTGIFKAFEVATGTNLDKTSKDVANEEMVRTGEIANSINNSGKAADLIIRIKEEVVNRDLKDPEEIRQVIINISNELNVKLTEEQIKQLVSLMQKIDNLNLDVSQINTQLKDIRAKLDELAAQGEGIRGLLRSILDIISRIFAGIRSLFGA